METLTFEQAIKKIADDKGYSSLDEWEANEKINRLAIMKQAAELYANSLAAKAFINGKRWQEIEKNEYATLPKNSHNTKRKALTLEEAKEKIGKKTGYGYTTIDKVMDLPVILEVVQLYANSLAAKAWEEGYDVGDENGFIEAENAYVSESYAINFEKPQNPYKIENE